MKMTHLLVSGPIVAFGSAVGLFLYGASWWVVAAAFFLTAPGMVLLAYSICTWVYPCAPELLKQVPQNAFEPVEPGAGSVTTGRTAARESI